MGGTLTLAASAISACMRRVSNATSVRLPTCSLRMMWCTCALTVLSDMPNRWAMTLLGMPLASRPRCLPARATSVRLSSRGRPRMRITRRYLAMPRLDVLRTREIAAARQHKADSRGGNFQIAGNRDVSLQIQFSGQVGGRPDVSASTIGPIGSLACLARNHAIWRSSHSGCSEGSIPMMAPVAPDSVSGGKPNSTSATGTAPISPQYLASQQVRQPRMKSRLSTTMSALGNTLT